MIRCPNCGGNSYVEKYSISTALYAPKQYINGELQYNDPNYHTCFCTCIDCGKEFSYNIGPNNYVVNKEKIEENFKQYYTMTTQESYEFRKKQLKERIAELQKELQELEFRGNYLTEIAPSTYKSNATCGE